jgi:lipopolysaccharide transport system ATP-binding protein
LGMSRREIERKFDEIVAFAEVEKFLDTPVKRYSSGMYVRLAFAVAAHLEPEILIVDEVLAVGDAQFQKKCLGKMEEVGKEGRTVLFVSHQMSMIQNLCSTGLLMNAGSLALSGRIEDVVQAYLEDSSRNSDIPLVERKDRKGTGAFQVISIAYEDSNGKRISSIQSGASLDIIFSYKKKPNIYPKSFEFSVAICKMSEENLVIFSNQMNGQEIINDLSDEGEIRLKIDRLRITEGRYSLKLYCTLNGEVTDWLQSASFLDVESGDYYMSGRMPSINQGALLLDYDFLLENRVRPSQSVAEVF